MRLLWANTVQLYQRFALGFTYDNAINGIMEETQELLDAIVKHRQSPSVVTKRHIAEEAADVLVTVISALEAASISPDEFEQAMEAVKLKNSQKNEKTHTVHHGKITRIDKINEMVRRNRNYPDVDKL